MKKMHLYETANRRTKRNEIWDSVLLVEHEWGTFDFVVFIVILGSLGARFSKWPVIRKPLSAERNGLKFETHLY